LLVALAPALLFLSGCGEKWAEVFPVTGTVKYNGQIPVGALIVLLPVAPAAPDAVVPTGTVKDDGTFVITSYESGDGAPAGDYVATIQWYKFNEKLGGSGPNVLPADYSSAKSSPIKVTVNGGGPTEVPPITISSAKTTRVGTARVARR
jgi:hypothetical protein